ncbi:MAG: glutathione S-transferase [Rhodospirillales bacterium]|nr:glutathione S-transferase [Rhodospirillales bacterium]
MIDLYMFSTGNSWRASIALEELGLPYTVKWINLREGEQFKPPFQSKSPLGRLPVIEDHDGPDGKPVIVYSSPAILMYVAEKTGRLLPTKGRARATALEWLMFAVSDLGLAFDFRFRYQTMLPRRGDAPDEYAINDLQGLVDRYCARLDQRLGQSRYMADDYSIADIASIVFIGGPRADPALLDRFPNIRRWVDELTARPAVKKGFRLEA